VIRAGDWEQMQVLGDIVESIEDACLEEHEGQRI